MKNIYEPHTLEQHQQNNINLIFIMFNKTRRNNHAGKSSNLDIIITYAFLSPFSKAGIACW